jgi:hypothetical protein
LCLSDEGVLNLLDEHRNVVWKSGDACSKSESPYSLCVTDGGRLELCDRNDDEVWSMFSEPSHSVYPLNVQKNAPLRAEVRDGATDYDYLLEGPANYLLSAHPRLTKCNDEFYEMFPNDKTKLRVHPSDPYLMIRYAIIAYMNIDRSDDRNVESCSDTKIFQYVDPSRSKNKSIIQVIISTPRKEIMSTLREVCLHKLLRQITATRLRGRSPGTIHPITMMHIDNMCFIEVKHI